MDNVSRAIVLVAGALALQACSGETTGEAAAGAEDVPANGASGDAVQTRLLVAKREAKVEEDAETQGAGDPGPVVAPPSRAGSEPDFGNDSSEWANDGECDDPRFAGPGTASILLEQDRMRDASDCRALFRQGRVYLAGNRRVEDGTPTPTPTPSPTRVGIRFGDDSSEWANDGECDDPRFAGRGMATTLLEEDRMRDATDCRTLFEQGRIQLAPSSRRTPEPDPSPVRTPRPTVRFGDDSSEWANDGECDDPRFTGRGMAATLLEEDRMRDATDCRSLYENGSITLRQ